VSRDGLTFMFGEPCSMESHVVTCHAFSWIAGCYNSTVNAAYPNLGGATSTVARVIARITGAGTPDTSVYMTDA
jgi:hypothetical protein